MLSIFKKKLKWTDLAIIIIIIAGIAGVTYKFSKANVAAPAVSKDKLQVSYYMEYVPDSTIQSLKIGDLVRDTVQNSYLGKIVEINTGESIYWASRDDGQIVSSPKEGYSSLEIIMEAEGIINPNGVSIDKSVYHVGMTISLYAGNAILEGGNGRISEIVKASAASNPTK